MNSSAYSSKLAAVLVGDDGVSDAHTVHVGHDRLHAILVGVVGKQHARVPHQCSCKISHMIIL